MKKISLSILFILSIALGISLAFAIPYGAGGYGDGKYEGTPEVRFLRGDSNGDGGVDLSDPIFTLNAVFKGENAERFNACHDAADANNDGAIDVSDPIYLLLFLFAGGRSPPEPFPESGLDPNNDELSCQCYPASAC